MAPRCLFRIRQRQSPIRLTSLVIANNRFSSSFSFTGYNIVVLCLKSGFLSEFEGFWDLEKKSRFFWGDVLQFFRISNITSFPRRSPQIDPSDRQFGIKCILDIIFCYRYFRRLAIFEGSLFRLLKRVLHVGSSKTKTGKKSERAGKAGWLYNYMFDHWK